MLEQKMQFFNFFGKKKWIFMKMNPLGWFSTEGKKKFSERGSGWGVTPLEKLGKERKTTCHGGSWYKWTSEGKEKNARGVRGSRKSSNPSRRKEKQWREEG